MAGAVYDRVAADYLAMVPEDPATGTSTLAIATKALLGVLGAMSGQRVLDLGCGEGHVARRVQATGGTVVGVDISDALLAVARQRSPSVQFLKADAQDLSPLPDACFDVVYCNLALMDIPDLSATYAAVARVLRPGGRFILTVVHPCFGTPGSDIAPDPDGRIRAAVVRRYTEEGHWTSGRIGGWRNKVGAHHRMVSTYINALLAAGFVLTRMDEPALRDRDDLADIAELYAHLPPVLLVEARRETVPSPLSGTRGG